MAEHHMRHATASSPIVDLEKGHSLLLHHLIIVCSNLHYYPKWCWVSYTGIRSQFYHSVQHIIAVVSVLSVQYLLVSTGYPL